jgi:hypothetical protein
VQVFEVWPEMAAEFQTLIEGYVSLDTSLKKMAESSSTFKTNPMWARWLNKAEEVREDEAVQTDRWGGRALGRWSCRDGLVLIVTS